MNCSRELNKLVLEMEVKPGFLHSSLLQRGLSSCQLPLNPIRKQTVSSSISFSIFSPK